MTESKIIKKNGRPVFSVNGEVIAPCAYITYFEERSCYNDFADAGYKLFSVNTAFSSLPLNSSTGFAPFYGIFDNKEKPDFSKFDRDIHRVLSADKNAYIFPRVSVTMPQWWVDSHPNETVFCPDGNRREALYSESFLQTGDEMLKKFIRHVQSSDYAENIIGYQIAGGYTQEWFHFDFNGSVSGCTEIMFGKYLKKHYPNEYPGFIKAPADCNFSGLGMIEDIFLQRYIEFVNASVAETIAHFAAAIKELTFHKQTVGTFYGYCLETVNPLSGTHALSTLLDCPDIDFFCSPVGYIHTRPLGYDWSDMTVGESIKLHNKMYFLECDIRTFLSDYPGNCRAGADPQKKYTGAVWKGPETAELSVSAIRKAFYRQLTHSNGLWWFDMWGGWYSHPLLMAEMKQFRQIIEEDILNDTPYTQADVALFADEKIYRKLCRGQPICNVQSDIRIALGNTGIPYDSLFISDMKECIKYKAIILPIPFDTEETVRLKEICRKHGIPVLQASFEKSVFSPEELRDFLKGAGVWCYCESNDVIYKGRGYICIHAASGGEKEISLEKTYKITPVNQQIEPFASNKIRLYMKQFETSAFKIEHLKRTDRS